MSRIMYDDHGNARRMPATSEVAQLALAKSAEDDDGGDGKRSPPLVRAGELAVAASERAAAMAELRGLRPAPRRDLAGSYVAAEEALIARDTARARQAMRAGDAKEHHRVARMVVERCFGIYVHPHGERVARRLVGGAGHTAQSWGWPW